jgi:hypothetical protein
LIFVKFREIGLNQFYQFKKWFSCFGIGLPVNRYNRLVYQFQRILKPLSVNQFIGFGTGLPVIPIDKPVILIDLP